MAALVWTPSIWKTLNQPSEENKWKTFPTWFLSVFLEWMRYLELPRDEKEKDYSAPKLGFVSSKTEVQILILSVISGVKESMCRSTEAWRSRNVWWKFRPRKSGRQGRFV